MRLKPFVRVCSFCGDKKNKNELVRFSKDANQVKLSESGKGIYLCKKCIKEINDQKMLCKAFKTKISQSNSDELLKQLKEF